MIFLALVAGAGVLAGPPARAEPLPQDGVHQVLRWGSHGTQVERVQRRLARLGYYVGPFDGVYAEETRTAVWAFQKHHGLEPVNRIDSRTWAALERPRTIRTMLRTGPRGRDRVEISLRKQLLVVWRDGRPRLVSHISTGANTRYCHGGYCRIARTPLGLYRVRAKARGWRSGPLGAMYSALYFNGGIAMHGSTTVPRRPASHGCVRIPLDQADVVFKLVRRGTPVHVLRA